MFSFLDRSSDTSFWYGVLDSNPIHCDVKTIVDQTYDTMRRERGWGPLFDFFLEGLVKWWIRGPVQSALSAWKFDHIQNIYSKNAQEQQKNYSSYEADQKAQMTFAKNTFLNNPTIMSRFNTMEKDVITEGLNNLAEHGTELLGDLGHFAAGQLGKLLGLKLVNPIDMNIGYSDKEKAVIEFDPRGDLFAKLLHADGKLTLSEKAHRWDCFVNKYSSDPKQLLIDRVARTLYPNSYVKSYVVAHKANAKIKSFSASVTATV